MTDGQQREVTKEKMRAMLVEVPVSKTYLLSYRRFSDSLDECLDYQLSATGHSWMVHSRYLVEHSQYFARVIEEAKAVCEHLAFNTAIILTTLGGQQDVIHNSRGGCGGRCSNDHVHILVGLSCFRRYRFPTSRPDDHEDAAAKYEKARRRNRAAAQS